MGFCYNYPNMDKQTIIDRVRGLQDTYRANEQVQSQLSHIKLIAVVGPTGAGKSTVVRQSGLPFVVGDTTRAPREGEIQGRDYNFRSDLNNMLAEIERGEFVQFVVQRETEIYGTKASSYPASGVCAMSVLASVLPVFRKIGFASVTPVYIVPPSHTEWMHRISAHRDKDLESRLLEAKDSLAVALNDPSYVFILNDDLSSAVASLQAVARGSVDQTASAHARSSANTLYGFLQKVIR
jgi:guanylate kinase